MEDKVARALWRITHPLLQAVCQLNYLRNFPQKRISQQLKPVRMCTLEDSGCPRLSTPQLQFFA
jgi:hypothetical protein